MVAALNTEPQTISALVPLWYTGGFDLHPFQRDIFESAERYDRLVVVASRQIGKTEALCRYGSLFAQTRRDTLTLVVSAGERQAGEVLKRVKRSLYDQIHGEPLLKESATEIQLSNRSRLISLPNSPRTVRGFPADLLIIDEVDSIEDWEEFKTALFPSVSRRGGKIICSGTYQGKRQLYGLTQDKEWRTCGPYAWTVNPPPDIQKQRHDLPPSRFAQEFECIPIDAASTLFPFELLDSCTGADGDNIPRKLPNALYFGGWDPAKLQDASMFYVLELPEGADRARVKIIKDYHGMNYSAQAAEIAEMHKYLHFYSVHVDCTGVGQGPLELLEGLLGSVVTGVTFTQNVKQQLFNDLRIGFQDRQIVIWPSDTILRRELHDLNPDTLKLESGSPDRACALALAWSGAKSSQRGPRLAAGAILSRPSDYERPSGWN